MEDLDLTERIRARIEQTGADFVVLPERVHEQTGKGVYAQGSLFVVKRLRSEGVNAAYLDEPENRYFVTEKSAIVTALGVIGIGIITNAAWDGIKALVSLIRGTSNDPITITVTDATETQPAETTVTGSPAQVLDALEQLKARDLLDPGLSDQSVLPAMLVPTGPSGTEVTQAPPLPTEFSQQQIDAGLTTGRELLERSRSILDGPDPDVTEAEALARRALPAFRSALDWAEDSNLEDVAHKALDDAGRWVCETFSCGVEYTDGTYYQTCPVALAHNRIGFSVGGVATRQCSLCDLDISECEHEPTTEYLIAGTMNPDGYCRICVKQECTEHRPHLQYKTKPVSIITEMMLDEISIVARPAQPDARVLREELSTRRLQETLGDKFVPGMPVSCERCLDDCGGLIPLGSPQGG